MATTITPGTTPTLTFTIPFETSSITALYISFMKAGAVRVEKDISHCTLGEKTISCALTQEETLKFGNEQKIEIQIRAKKTTGEAVASNVMSVMTSKVLKDGVI